MDLPMKQLSELFDVNHFIVSQVTVVIGTLADSIKVNPHIAPVLGIKRRFPKLLAFTANEVRLACSRSC